MGYPETHIDLGRWYLRPYQEVITAPTASVLASIIAPNNGLGTPSSEMGRTALNYLRERKWGVSEFWALNWGVASGGYQIPVYFLFGNSPLLKGFVYFCFRLLLACSWVLSTVKGAVLSTYTYIYTCIRTQIILVRRHVYMLCLCVLILVYYLYSCIWRSIHICTMLICA